MPPIAGAAAGARLVTILVAKIVFNFSNASASACALVEVMSFFQSPTGRNQKRTGRNQIRFEPSVGTLITDSHVARLEKGYCYPNRSCRQTGWLWW